MSDDTGSWTGMAAPVGAAVAVNGVEDPVYVGFVGAAVVFGGARVRIGTFVGTRALGPGVLGVVGDAPFVEVCEYV